MAGQSTNHHRRVVYRYSFLHKIKKPDFNLSDLPIKVVSLCTFVLRGPEDVSCLMTAVS